MKRCTILVALLAVVVLASSGLTQQKADVAKGKATYATYCASCHGAGGKGDGPAAAGLNPKPQDHTNAAAMGKLTDKYLEDIIKKGGAGVGKSALMPPWAAALKDPDVQNVIAFMRSLAKK